MSLPGLYQFAIYFLHRVIPQAAFYIFSLTSCIKAADAVLLFVIEREVDARKSIQTKIWPSNKRYQLQILWDNYSIVCYLVSELQRYFRFLTEKWHQTDLF